MSLRKEFIVESEVNRTLRMAGRHEEEKPLTLIMRELRRQLLNVTLCWMDAPTRGISIPLGERCAIGEFLGQLSSSYVVNLMIF